MNTNDGASDVVVAPVIGGLVLEQMTAMALKEMLAEAHQDLIAKGVALRQAVLRSRNGHGLSDLAYAAWKQAQATATAIYSEVKARRQKLATLKAA